MGKLYEYGDVHVMCTKKVARDLNILQVYSRHSPIKADNFFQLEMARKYIPYHMEKFGYKQPNVEFVEGYIEKLTDAGVKENSQDIIM